MGTSKRASSGDDDRCTLPTRLRLCDLIRDVSDDVRNPHSAPLEALRNYAHSADLMGHTCFALGKYLEAVATDKRIPDDLRFSAAFWRQALDKQLEDFWDEGSSLAWWFKPALEGSGVSNAGLQEFVDGMVEKHAGLLIALHKRVGELIAAQDVTPGEAAGRD